MTQITGLNVQNMISDWLATPTNGYLGSSYGQDLPSLLQQPLSAGVGADAFLAKLKVDVPILQIMPANSVNLFSVPTPPDKLDIVLQVGASAFTIG